MHIWIHDKSVQFHQRQTSSMAEKNCFDVTKLFFQVMCVTVVQWSRSCLHLQINRVRLPATLFSVSLYRFFFFVFFFFSSVWSLFNSIFPFGLFFFIFTADPAGHALGSIYILSVSREFFGKRDFKSPLLICILANLTTRKKPSCQDMSLPWNSWFFFNFS